MTFPYIGIIDFGTYTQPYALLLGSAIAIYHHKNIRYNSLLVIQISVSLFFLLVAGTAGLRPFLGLFSFTLSIALADFLMDKIGKNHIKSIVLYSAIVWLVVALIQIFRPNFGSFIVPMWREVENRGVNGLAQEPSYLGLYGVLLFIYSAAAKDRKVQLISLVLVILSQSLFSWIVLVSVLYIVGSLKSKLITLLVSILILISPFSTIFSVRTAFLIERILSDPIALVQIDESIGDRVAHVILPFYEFFQNGGFPHGFEAWPDAVGKSVLLKRLGLHWVTTGRIMSSIGALIFEYGWLALPAVIFVCRTAIKSKLVFAIIFLYIFQLPFALMLAPFIIKFSQNELQEKI